MGWNYVSIPETLTAQLLKFGKGYVISFHTLLDMGSVNYAGIVVD